MDRKAKVYGSIIAAIVLMYFLSSNFDIAALDDLFNVVLLVGGIGLVGKVVQDFKVRDKIQSLSKSRSGSGLNYGIDDCRDIAQDWAKNNYQGDVKSKKGMSFDWTQAKSDLAPVYDFTDQEWIYARYFYTQYGPKNKGTLIFIDATNGEVLSPKPVKKHKLKDNPFKHLAMYKQTRRFASRIGMSGDDDGDRRLPANFSQGIPVQGGYYPAPNDNTGSEGGS